MAVFLGLESSAQLSAVELATRATDNVDPASRQPGDRQRSTPSSSPVSYSSPDTFLATQPRMTNRYYHGTRTELTLRGLIAPAVTSAADDHDPAPAPLRLPPNSDA